MPDLALQIANRQDQNREIWKTPEWKRNSEKYLEEFPICQWCGKPSQVVHHPDDRWYGKPQYLDFWFCKCLALCNHCHHALHKGLVLCPRCRNGYCLPTSDHCRKCETLEEKRVRLARVQAIADAKRAAQDRSNARQREIYHERQQRQKRLKNMCRLCGKNPKLCGKRPWDCAEENKKR